MITIAALTLPSLSATATVILSERFTDGDLGFGSDANDGGFLRQQGISQTMSIVSDNVIGNGNAMAYSNQVNGTLVVGRLQSPAVLGTNVGDEIEFSFDFRMTQLPTSPNSSIFRFGLYNHAGASPTDGGAQTDPDNGYSDNFGAGGSPGDAGWGKESGGADGLLGGLGAASVPGGTTIQPVDINDTARHHALCRLTRTAGGIALATFFDDTQVDSASDNSGPFISFNEIAFRLTGQAAANYDNIIVQTLSEPLLNIRLTTTNTVAVSWPSPWTGFTLQQNTNGIISVNWSNLTSGILDDGSTKTLIVNPPVGNRFYRLFKP